MLDVVCRIDPTATTATVEESRSIDICDRSCSSTPSFASTRSRRPRRAKERAMDHYHSIRPQGFAIEQVRLVIGQSYLFDKCQFIYGTENILELIIGFDQLMASDEIEFGAETLGVIHVAGIMVYMLHHHDLAATQIHRSLFLKRCFDFMACTEETHVHQVCVQILCLLDMNSTTNMINLIICCRHAGPLSTMGQVICTCLLWSILDRLTDIGLDAHRLRAYADIMMAISSVNPTVYVQSYLHALNLTVRAIAALLTIGPYGSTDKLRLEVGVPEELLHFPAEDAAVLFRWLNSIVSELRSDLHVKDALAKERMIILEETCELLKLVHNHLVQVYERICLTLQASIQAPSEVEEVVFRMPRDADEDGNFLG